MIQLNPDCLIFQTASGENIPCSAELVTIELIGEAAEHLDPEIIQNASAAVLHYFKVELDRHFVTVAEFSEALEKILRSFGLSVKAATAQPTTPKTEESDLRHIASTSCELLFFPQLRDELRRKLSDSPEVLRFNGLRGCVKQLTGAQRWCHRCEEMSDQIVDFLRTCLTQDSKGNSCALVVQ
jgi:hypothetical protein